MIGGLFGVPWGTTAAVAFLALVWGGIAWLIVPRGPRIRFEDDDLEDEPAR